MSVALAISTPAFVDTGVRSDDRERWLALRRTGVGASDAAVVVGESTRYATIGSLWAEKLGLVPGREDTERFQWGRRDEATVCAAYSEPRYSGRRAWLDGRLLRSTSLPFALATLDAKTIHPEVGEVPLELKGIEIFRADEWADGAPLENWWQCQHQMLVTGDPVASIACRIGLGRLVWEDVKRDETAIRKLARALETFWRHVEDRTEPGPIDAETTYRLFPEDDGSVIELNSDVVALDVEREEIAAQLRALSKRKEEIDDALRVRIRGAERGVLPGGLVSYSWKTQDRREYVVPAKKMRVLRRHAPKKEG